MFHGINDLQDLILLVIAVLAVGFFLEAIFRK